MLALTVLGVAPLAQQSESHVKVRDVAQTLVATGHAPNLSGTRGTHCPAPARQPVEGTRASDDLPGFILRYAEALTCLQTDDSVEAAGRVLDARLAFLSCLIEQGWMPKPEDHVGWRPASASCVYRWG